MTHIRKQSPEELNRLSVEAFKATKKIPVVVVLDNVRSMHNVGSVFRSADAFLVERIILCGYTPTPPHRDIQKTALGATETVAWTYAKEVTDALDLLAAEDYTLTAVELAEPSYAPDMLPFTPERLALVFGNEVTGVQDEALLRCSFAIEIPQYGAKHSLNIGVAAGVVLYEMRKLFL